MTYRIELLSAARRDLAALPRQVRDRIAAKIELLAIDPRPPGAKALQGEARGLMRIRLEDWRVVYRVRDRELVVLVVMAAHRSEVYRRLGRR
jgi:mRNA interferase RelE/StbE